MLDEITFVKYPPHQKIRRVKKLPPICFCKSCKTLIPTTTWHRKYCDECRKPTPKPEKPTTREWPCRRCGVQLIAPYKSNSNRYCDSCKKLNKAEATVKLLINPELRAKIYAKNNARAAEKRRAAGNMTMDEWAAEQRRRSEQHALNNPTKVCKACGSEQLRYRFKSGMVCRTCTNKRRIDREKCATHPKRIAMAVEQERREILKRFDLFTQERAESKAAAKIRARVKERSTPAGRLDRNISESVRTALKNNKSGWRSSIG